MRRENVLLFIGLFIFISPFIGLPMSVLSWLLPLSAVGVLGIGYTLRARSAYTKASLPIQ
jgi:hypothetical protein